MRELEYGSRGKSQFARDLGIGPSTYDRYERDRIPPADLLLRMARLTGSRLEWLITGEGIRQQVPEKDSPQIASLIERLRALGQRDPQAAHSVESFLDVLERTAASLPPVHRSTLVTAKDLVPVVGSTAAGIARFWEELEGATVGPEVDGRLEQLLTEYEAESVTRKGALRTAGATQQQHVSLVQLSRPDDSGFLEFLDGTTLRSQHPQAVAWRIDGESMSPRYVDGDFVITSASQPAVPGHPCVARQRGQIGVNCKLFQQQGDEILLVPVNELSETQRFPASQLVWAYRVLCSVRLQ